MLKRFGRNNFIIVGTRSLARTREVQADDNGDLIYAGY